MDNSLPIAAVKSSPPDFQMAESYYENDNSFNIIASGSHHSLPYASNESLPGLYQEEDPWSATQQRMDSVTAKMEQKARMTISPIESNFKNTSSTTTTDVEPTLSRSHTPKILEYKKVDEIKVLLMIEFILFSNRLKYQMNPSLFLGTSII